MTGRPIRFGRRRGTGALLLALPLLLGAQVPAAAATPGPPTPGAVAPTWQTATALGTLVAAAVLSGSPATAASLAIGTDDAATLTDPRTAPADHRTPGIATHPAGGMWLDIAMPIWDAPGALVPVVVTLHHPPDAAAITLTGDGRRGATMTCQGPAWRNSSDDTLSRACYVQLPLTGDRFPLHAIATVARAGAPDRVLDQQASRNLRSLGPASPAPFSTDDARAVERCGNRTDTVWLTFDDGATPAGLRSILATLKRNGVRGRFFFRGDWAAANPDLMRLITREGHLLGDHTYRHLPLNRETDAVVKSQIRRGVHPTTSPPLLRPPGGAGAFSTRLRDLAATQGMDVCRWTTDTYDWTGVSAARIVERVRSGDALTPPVRAGGVILMHGYGAHTAAALQGVIDAVRAKGLTLDPLR
ncbi:MAG: polysaccharide deacetylase family protein [Chloroflexota bacterium]